jgi:hypothetical protein
MNEVIAIIGVLAAMGAIGLLIVIVAMIFWETRRQLWCVGDPLRTLDGLGEDWREKTKALIQPALWTASHAGTWRTPLILRDGGIVRPLASKWRLKMHTTEKHSADFRTFSEAELDQVSGAGLSLVEYLIAAYHVGTVPYQTGKLAGLHRSE